MIPPSAWIFNTSIALMGLLLLVGAYYFHRSYRWKPATALILLVGIGCMGVGFFPETAGSIHSYFADVAFLFAGLASIVTSRFQKVPMSYFSIILGAMSLLAVILYRGDYFAGLGAGGMERMIVYPIVLWGISFGGYLMATEDKPKT
jgi:hypothetical membrane protein